MSRREAGNSNNQTPIITGGGLMEQPKGLLDGISEIEYIYQQELSGVDLSGGYFTSKNRLSFYELGMRTTLISGLVMSLMVPFAIGVIERNIPVFGSTDPSLFDQVFVLLISVSYMIGYAAFIGWGCSKYYGDYSKSMVRNLMSGVTMAASIKVVIMFIFFNFCYLVLFTRDSLLSAFTYISRNVGTHISHTTIEKSYLWCLEFRDAFLWSAWYIVITTVFYLSWIYICYFRADIRNRKIRSGDLKSSTHKI